MNSTSRFMDDHYHFGMLIAQQMRSMDPMLAMVAKTRITQTMFDLMYPEATFVQNTEQNVSRDRE